MDIQKTCLGTVLLACMGFMTTGTYGECHDDSLSLYVTGDGYIRVRLTRPDTLTARRTVQTRCGLRCACFAKMFLCCSDADCITVDHLCPAHHLNFPPASLIEAVPFRSVKVMDQSTKVTLNPQVIYRSRLQTHPVALQNLDPIEGHNIVAAGDQAIDSEIPALVAHAQPQIQTNGEKSSVHTDVTKSRKGILSSRSNQPNTHLDSDSKPFISKYVSRSDQVPMRGRLSLLEVLKKDAFNDVQDQVKDLRDVAEDPAEAGVDTTSTWRNMDSELTPEEVVMLSVPTESPAQTSPASQSLRTTRSENTDAGLEADVTLVQTETSDNTLTLELRRKKRSNEITVTEQQFTTEEATILLVATEAPGSHDIQMPPLRKKRSDENTATEQLLTTEEVVIPALITEAPHSSDRQMPPLRKKRSDENTATEQLLTTEEVVIPALITEAPYSSDRQMPPSRKKRSDENTATEQLLTTEEVVIPALITEAPYSSDHQIPPLRKKRSDENTATEELLTTENVIVPALPTEAPHTPDHQMPPLRKK